MQLGTKLMQLKIEVEDSEAKKQTKPGYAHNKI